MRIALVIERLDPSRGGRETSTAQIAAALTTRGHEVTVLCQDGVAGDWPFAMRQLGRRGASRWQRAIAFAADAGAAAAKGKFEIVHATLPIPGANVYQPRGGTVPGQLAAGRRRWGAMGPLRKWLVEPMNLTRRMQAIMEQRLVANPRAMCLAVSQMVAEEFAHYYGLQDNVRVVYNGVDLPARDDAARVQHRRELRGHIGADEGETVFVTVATNPRLKGVDFAIDAFGRWCASRGDRPGGRLVVIGGREEASLRHRSARAGAAERVTFVPHTSDMAAWYAAADACILLSWYDPCSRVVLEAVAMGVPAITTVFNGAAEILADGAGIVVSSPRDAVGVAVALDALGDPPRRAATAEACTRAADGITIDRHVRQLLGVYSEVLV